MKEKIQRTFVREEAYLQLRNSIIEGSLKPGEQLRDKELAEKLGVSRTPIREALLRLEDEGLVQTKPNCSTLVSPLDFQSASHLYAIVSSLEQLALTQAFPSIRTDHIEAMERANQHFLHALQTRHLLSALNGDYDFHCVYIKLSHNKELEQILLRLKQKLKRLDIYYYEHVPNANSSHDEHTHIIDALKHNDLAQALRAVENNWKESSKRINSLNN